MTSHNPSSYDPMSTGMPQSVDLNSRRAWSDSAPESTINASTPSDTDFRKSPPVLSESDYMNNSQAAWADSAPAPTSAPSQPTAGSQNLQLGLGGESDWNPTEVWGGGAAESNAVRSGASCADLHGRSEYKQSTPDRQASQGRPSSVISCAGSDNNWNTERSGQSRSDDDATLVFDSDSNSDRTGPEYSRPPLSRSNTYKPSQSNSNRTGAGTKLFFGYAGLAGAATVATSIFNAASAISQYNTLGTGIALTGAAIGAKYLYDKYHTTDESTDNSQCSSNGASRRSRGRLVSTWCDSVYPVAKSVAGTVLSTAHQAGKCLGKYVCDNSRRDVYYN